MRRALAVAGYGGKLYVHFGITDSNEVTPTVSLYDPKSQQRSEGPSLLGKGMDTIGLSAFGGKRGLFATMAEGSLLRLADDGKSWQNWARCRTLVSFIASL